MKLLFIFTCIPIRGVIMSEFFGIYNVGQPFEIFSTPHKTALISIVLVNIFIFIFSARLKDNIINKFIRYSLAVILILMEVSLNVWYIVNNTWSLEFSLPIQLCDASLFLCIFMLFTKSYRVYEIAYFWGLGGATQALLTPEIGNYNYMHYFFYQFFISHGVVVISVLFMTFVLSFSPGIKSLIRSFLFLNIYCLFAGTLNILTGGNYLFICQKPETASLLNYLGPWPWYIISLEFVSLLIFGLLYSPFAIRDLLHKKSGPQLPTNFSG